MSNFLTFFNNLINFDFLTVYQYVYEYLYIVCNYSFNYCPLHYQMIYFYFPLMFTITNRVKSKLNLQSTHYNSTANYVFLMLNNLFKKLVNLNLIVFVILRFFKKLFLFIKVFYKNTFFFKFNLIKKFIHKNHLWLTWKPIFKKLSYHGVFAFIRTKWYKNK